MFKLLVVFAFVPAIFARTPVRECVGGHPLPNAVFFGSRDNPCTAPPCELSRTSGSGTTFVDFVPKFDTQGILPQVRATVFAGVTITQQLPADIAANPCGILTQGSCPLSANEPVSYALTLPVDAGTPLLSPDTEITLFGDNNQVIFCYRLQTRIVA